MAVTNNDEKARSGSTSAIVFRLLLACDLKDFAHTLLSDRRCFENVWRTQKSRAVEDPGISGPNCGGRVGLSFRNGLVPDEDERYGSHEVRRAAKTIRLRQPCAV